MHAENVPIQNAIKISWNSLVEHQRNQLLGTAVIVTNQEQERQYPDSGVSMNSSTEQKACQNQGIKYYIIINVSTESFHFVLYFLR